jgi:flagellar M-ring protein FliF
VGLDAKQIATQCKQLWSRLPPRRRAVFGAAIAGTLLLMWLLVGHTAAERRAVLFSGLAAEDAGEVVARLRELKVAYRVEAGGSAISVPEARVHELRIALASEGVPRGGGGVGFEIFDKQSFGATSFVEQMNYRRALQGELQRTIMSLDAVEHARVHVALGERSLYRKEDEPPSASVVLKLRRGKELSEGQVRGVVNLVAASVDGLRAERVTVVDETGKVLSSSENDADSDDARVLLERQLERRVEDILAPVVGVGHVEVAVTAELDRTQVERTEELWDGDKPAVRSESRTVEGQADAIGAGVGGVAGARGNLPGAPAPATLPTGGGTSASRLQETRNYELSRTTSHSIGPRVRIKRLHVAVVVDGVTVGTGAARKLEPRGKDELARIEGLAREAAGLDVERGDRIEVASVPFAIEAEVDPAPAVAVAWPLSRPATMAAGGGALLLLLAVVILLLRRRRQTELQMQRSLPALPLRVVEYEQTLRAPPAELPAANPAPTGLPGRSARERAMEAARADAERAALVLQAWLGESAEPRPAGGER